MDSRLFRTGSSQQCADYTTTCRKLKEDEQAHAVPLWRAVLFPLLLKILQK
jgi:hypothetical protein